MTLVFCSFFLVSIQLSYAPWLLFARVDGLELSGLPLGFWVFGGSWVYGYSCPWAVQGVGAGGRAGWSWCCAGVGNGGGEGSGCMY